MCKPSLQRVPPFQETFIYATMPVMGLGTCKTIFPNGGSGRFSGSSNHPATFRASLKIIEIYRDHREACPINFNSGFRMMWFLRVPHDFGGWYSFGVEITQNCCWGELFWVKVMMHGAWHQDTYIPGGGATRVSPKSKDWLKGKNTSKTWFSPSNMTGIPANVPLIQWFNQSLSLVFFFVVRSVILRWTSEELKNCCRIGNPFAHYT